jgi:uroporphyrin-III C-methyltransferase/precorrin-2 dehydrogenase/sirohydrochlorin ferrochelatase
VEPDSSLPVLLKNPRILLIGGGRVALHKARVLRDNGVEFSLLAASLVAELQELDDLVPIRRKRLEVADLAPFNIIIDATGDATVAALLQQEKTRRFLLLNSVDAPERCDFYFSALLNRGRLKIAVSSDGASPTLARTVRDRIDELLPDNLDQLLERSAVERSQGRVDAATLRQETRRRLVDAPPADGGLSRVDLVGCGPGEVALLTLQACRCIREAEVVLYDQLVSDEILELVAEDAERIPVGKRKSRHGLQQDAINAMLLAQAKRGLRVARLKSGDPYIFGRGAEEAAFLARHGVRVRVIPGLSSAMAAPAAAGIPLTARGYATNASIVSAHLAGSRFNHDWLPLLQIPNHTVVVLMGLSFAAEIAAAAQKLGIRPDLPVAIVANATRSDQRTLISCLGQLAADALRMQRPAVLVFGEVVRLHAVLPQHPAHG